jgi:arabinofuranosyltransferase
MAWGLLTLLALVHTTVIEDALIPVRVAQQFLAGNGLVWNIGERVQVSTSLPWQILIIPFVALTPENPAQGLALLGLILTSAATALTLRAARTAEALLLITAGWLAASTLRVYMVCGMEIALTGLVLSALIVRQNQGGKGWAFLAGSLPALRHDLILMAAPIVAARLPQILPQIFRQKPRNLKPTLLWLLCLTGPMVALTAFSLFYFGSPVPNTAYTKLAANFPKDETAWRGWEYLKASVEMDPTLWLIPFLAFALTWGRKNFRGQSLSPLAAGVAGGMILTWLYTWLYAADYMTGRFLLPPVVASLALLSLSRPTKNELWVALAIMAAAWGFQNPAAGQKPGLALEPRQGLFVPLRELLKDDSYQRMETTHIGRSLLPGQSTFQGTIGMVGSHAPLDHHIYDVLAIGDPLTARLPAAYGSQWTGGHYGRPSPAGEQDWVETNDPNQVQDPQIRELAILVQAAARDPLWPLTFDRFQKIWQLMWWRPSAEKKLAMTYPSAQPARPASIQKQPMILREDTVVEVAGSFLASTIKDGRRVKTRLHHGATNPSERGPWNFFFLPKEGEVTLLEQAEQAPAQKGDVYEAWKVPAQVLSLHPASGPPVVLTPEGDEKTPKSHRGWRGSAPLVTLRGGEKTRVVLPPTMAPGTYKVLIDPTVPTMPGPENLPKIAVQDPTTQTWRGHQEQITLGAETRELMLTNTSANPEQSADISFLILIPQKNP